MSKLVIIIGLVLAFFIIKHLINSRPASKSAGDEQDKNQGPQHLDYKDTVKCEYCGTHIPLADAYSQEKRHYCNEEHYKKLNKKSL